jgi:hypothetical protein
MTNNETIKRLYEANKAIFPPIIFGHETQFFLLILVSIGLHRNRKLFGDGENAR